MRTLLFIALSFSILFSNDWGKFLQKMQEKEAYYQDVNNSKIEKEKYMKKFNVDKQVQNEKEEHKDLLNTLNNNSNKSLKNSIPWITDNIISESDKKQLKSLTELIIKKNNKPKMVDTIFYLFSTSQSKYMYFNFVEEASKLIKVNPEIKFYGVLQGMISKKETDKLYIPFKFRDDLRDNAIIKMQPFIFRDLDLQVVPAYLFSKCPIGKFKYKSCENKYVVRGEISLQKAIGIIESENKEYSKYLKILEHGDY